MTNFSHEGATLLSFGDKNGAKNTKIIKVR